MPIPHPARFSLGSTGLLLACLGCYSGTSDSPADPGPSQSDPPPPPIVGAVVYGTISSASDQNLQAGAEAVVGVLDAGCVGPLPSITGIGEAPTYKGNLTYIARLTTRHEPFDACVLVNVSYAVPPLMRLQSLARTSIVRFTPEGASPLATGDQLDVVLP